MFEFVWPFCGVGAWRDNIEFSVVKSCQTGQTNNSVLTKEILPSTKTVHNTKSYGKKLILKKHYLVKEYC